MKKYKLAIVGATGIVGRTVLKVLEEKNFRGIVSEAVDACVKRSKELSLK